jgi:hypothetical protein
MKFNPEIHFKKELKEIRDFLENSPCNHDEVLIKSGELIVAFDLHDLTLLKAANNG